MKRVSYQDVIFAGLKSQDFCVSIYASNFSELQRLFEAAKLVAQQDLKSQEFLSLFESFEIEKNLIESFPVAVFLNCQRKMYVPLFRCEEEFFVVSTSFHIKPLIKMHQRNRDVALLSFSSNTVKLFKVSFNGMILLDVFKGPQCDKDFLLIDKFVSSLLSNNKPLLLFTGQRENVKKFIKLTSYKNIFEEPIDILQNFRSRELLKHIFRHIEPYFRKAEVKASRRVQLAKADERTTTDINEIFQSAQRGEVENLFIAEDKKIWGYLDARKNKVSTHKIQVDSYDEDILDDISEIVLKFKGSVVVLPQSSMPDKALMFAILRKKTKKSNNKNPK